MLNINFDNYSENPADASKLLIGFETGTLCLWDLSNKKGEQRSGLKIASNRKGMWPNATGVTYQVGIANDDVWGRCQL